MNARTGLMLRSLLLTVRFDRPYAIAIGLIDEVYQSVLQGFCEVLFFDIVTEFHIGDCSSDSQYFMATSGGEVLMFYGLLNEVF